MTPERLLRIRAVYEAAVDSPAAARQALLDHECEGDEELRQEVERLLGAREYLPAWLSALSWAWPTPLGRLIPQ
jgi:hypothetical protein